MIKLVKSQTKRIATEQSIVEVPISKVKLWKNNPRKNDRAVPKLAKIIESRGQVTPIVVWRKDGVAYKGNTTLKACKLLGYKTIKVLYADFPSEQAAIAYGIVDNKSSEWSSWDDEMLEGMFKMEKVPEFSGFDQVEQDLLIKRMVKNNEKELSADGLTTDHHCPKCGYRY